MIKIENVNVVGFEETIRGMRNPMNSWDKSDSGWTTDGLSEKDIFIEEDPEGWWQLKVGPNDQDLMLRLATAGPVDAKYRRMLIVYIDITAPLYWWKEFDTYKVGTVANSCSTMHKIHSKEFTLDDFSHEHLFTTEDLIWGDIVPISVLESTILALNKYRNLYNEAKDKEYWWQMIQLLPSSYNQKRTIMMNYEVLSNIYKHRKNHKLDEWRDFCSWIESLPLSEIITTLEYIQF